MFSLLSLYPLLFLFSVCSFPEMRYFQDEAVRTKLTDILFCYARENELLLYKQVPLHQAHNVQFAHHDRATRHAVATPRLDRILSTLCYTGRAWMPSQCSNRKWHTAGHWLIKFNDALSKLITQLVHHAERNTGHAESCSLSVSLGICDLADSLCLQGMHELLAPIVFVLHCDHQAFQHASETAHPRSVTPALLLHIDFPSV